MIEQYLIDKRVLALIAGISKCKVGQVVAVNESDSYSSPNGKTITVDVSTVVGAESILLQNLPIVILQGGGHYIQIKPVIGDYCLLVCSDEDMRTWYQGVDNGAVKTDRCHSLSDAFVIVGVNPLSGKLPAPEADIEISTDAILIKSVSCTVISPDVLVQSERCQVESSEKCTVISPDVLVQSERCMVEASERCDIEAPNVSITSDNCDVNSSNVSVQADKCTVNASSECSVTAPMANITGETTVTGNLMVTGGISWGGDATGVGGAPAKIKGSLEITGGNLDVLGGGDVKVGTISSKSHIHLAPTNGGPTTGPQ